MPLLTLQNLSKQFPSPDDTPPVIPLQQIDLTVEQGETVAIIGSSGSGKSTLLALLAGLDTPTSGSVHVGDQCISSFSENELTRFRATNLGIIFQQFYLLPHLTALENVALPLELQNDSLAFQKAQDLLKIVNLDHRLKHFPKQLSGGECQRVAIARALVVQPKLLLADEPSGNLDQQNGKKLADLLFDLVKSIQMTMILVTHSQELANRCNSIYLLQNGDLMKQYPSKTSV